MHALDGRTGLATLSDSTRARKPTKRRYFVGGSDARIIVGNDEAALLRLWREKRGEVEPEDLSGNLIVQLGLATGGAEPALVSGQHRPGADGHSAAYPTARAAL